MSKPKKKRNKSYRPKDASIPGLVFDLIRGPRLNANEFDILDSLGTAALTAVQLTSMSLQSFIRFDTICCHLYLLAPHFEHTLENRMLAQYARQALAVIWGDTNKPYEERLVMNNRDCAKTLAKVLGTALETVKTMWSNVSRQELEAMENALPTMPRPGDYESVICFPGDPDAEKFAGREGRVLIHGGVRPGSLAVVNGVTFWHSDDDRLIRITEPVFVVFTDREVPLKSA